MLECILRCPSDGMEFRVGSQEVTTIGRREGNGIVLPDPTVSRRHCAIEQQGGAFVLRDVESTSGTWLNGERLLGSRRLSDGDEIRVGRMILRVAFQALDPASRFGAALHGMRGEEASRQALDAWFSEHDLPSPPLPSGAPIYRFGDPVFASSPELRRRPYDLEWYLSRFPEELPRFVCGCDGHGLNSYGMHLLLARPGLSLFLQIPWGGVYTDAARANADVRRAFQASAVLLEWVEASMASRAIDPRAPLVVAHSFRFTPFWMAPGRRTPEQAPTFHAWELLEATLERLQSSTESEYSALR